MMSAGVKSVTNAEKTHVLSLLGRHRQGRLHRLRYIRRSRFAGNRADTRDLSAPAGKIFVAIRFGGKRRTGPARRR